MRRSVNSDDGGAPPPAHQGPMEATDLSVFELSSYELGATDEHGAFWARPAQRTGKSNAGGIAVSMANLDASEATQMSLGMDDVPLPEGMDDVSLGGACSNDDVESLAAAPTADKVAPMGVDKSTSTTWGEVGVGQAMTQIGTAPHRLDHSDAAATDGSEGPAPEDAALETTDDATLTSSLDVKVTEEDKDEKTRRPSVRGVAVINFGMLGILTIMLGLLIAAPGTIGPCDDPQKHSFAVWVFRNYIKHLVGAATFAWLCVIAHPSAGQDRHRRAVVHALLIITVCSIFLSIAQYWYVHKSDGDANRAGTWRVFDTAFAAIFVALTYFALKRTFRRPGSVPKMVWYTTLLFLLQLAVRFISMTFVNTYGDYLAKTQTSSTMHRLAYDAAYIYLFSTVFLTFGRGVVGCFDRKVFKFANEEEMMPASDAQRLLTVIDLTFDATRWIFGRIIFVKFAPLMCLLITAKDSIYAFSQFGYHFTGAYVTMHAVYLSNPRERVHRLQWPRTLIWIDRFVDFYGRFACEICLTLGGQWWYLRQYRCVGEDGVPVIMRDIKLGQPIRHPTPCKCSESSIRSKPSNEDQVKVDPVKTFLDVCPETPTEAPPERYFRVTCVGIRYVFTGVEVTDVPLVPGDIVLVIKESDGHAAMPRKEAMESLDGAVPRGQVRWIGEDGYVVVNWIRGAESIANVTRHRPDELARDVSVDAVSKAQKRTLEYRITSFFLSEEVAINLWLARPRLFALVTGSQQLIAQRFVIRSVCKIFSSLLLLSSTVFVHVSPARFAYIGEHRGQHLVDMPVSVWAAPLVFFVADITECTLLLRLHCAAAFDSDALVESLCTFFTTPMKVAIGLVLIWTGLAPFFDKTKYDLNFC